MSSWLFLPNPFNSEDNDDDQNSLIAPDHTISTLFRSVAAFLAPPPANSTSAAAAIDDGGAGGTVEVSSRAIAGMKQDLAEIGDSFKSSLSLLSSRFFTPKEDDAVEEEEEMVGITEEVVDYVNTLCERPQLWTDFPISLPNDFEMSANQREHVENIEQLVPDIGSLRQKVSGHLPNNKFWMIYFILLLPRLDENDLELLSTPKVVEVKDTFMQQLQNKNAHSDTRNSSLDNVKDDGSLQGNNDQLRKTTTLNSEESKLFKNEDAISFSDVDDNDLPDRITRSSGKKAFSSGESHEWVSSGGEWVSSGESYEWVHVSGKPKAWSRSSLSTPVVEEGSDSEGSCEWLTVDDVDSDTMATP